MTFHHFLLIQYLGMWFYQTNGIPMGTHYYSFHFASFINGRYTLWTVFSDRRNNCCIFFPFHSRHTSRWYTLTLLNLVTMFNTSNKKKGYIRKNTVQSVSYFYLQLAIENKNIENKTLRRQIEDFNSWISRNSRSCVSSAVFRAHLSACNSSCFIHFFLDSLMVIAAEFSQLANYFKVRISCIRNMLWPLLYYS